MSRYLSVGLALLAAAPAVQAQAAAPAATAEAPLPANAMQLSLLLNPEDKILAASDHAFKTGFQAALANDAAASPAFDEHPKLLDAIYDAAIPVVRKHVRADIPALQQKFARFFAGRFTQPEIDQLLAFYGSPTGTKLIAGMYAGVDLGGLIEAVGPDGSEPVSSDTMRDVLASTVTRIMPAFDATDRKAFAGFAKSPLFLKVRAATPEMIALMTEIANQPSPEMDAELEQVIDRVVADYFAGAERAATTG